MCAHSVTGLSCCADYRLVHISGQSLSHFFMLSDDRVLTTAGNVKGGRRENENNKFVNHLKVPQIMAPVMVIMW